MFNKSYEIKYLSFDFINWHFKNTFIDYLIFPKLKQLFSYFFCFNTLKKYRIILSNH